MHSATIFFALAAVVASASAGAIGGAGIAADIVARPAYQVSYGVSDKITGDQKSAVEVRDGAVTKGSYSLVQPDGVLRTVNYIVTPLGGFQAQVINKGVAAHPAIVGKALGGLGGLGAVAGPALGLGVGKGLAVSGLGLGLGARSVVGGLGLNGLGLVGANGLGLVGANGLGLVGANGLLVNNVGLVNGLGLGAAKGLGLGAGIIG